MNTQIQKIKSLAIEFGDQCRVWAKYFYKLATGESQITPKFLFTFFSWFCLLLFFSFFMLAEQNPFRLLIPFEIYSFPSYDRRSLVTVYIANGEGESLAVSRKLLIEENKHDFLNQLVGEISAPPYFDLSKEGNEKTGIFSPKKQLDIRFALRQVWFREASETLVFDWNVARLEAVMEAYRLPKIQSSTGDGEDEATNAPTDTDTYYSGGSEITQLESDDVLHMRRLDALRSTFSVLNQTILANMEPYNRIEHRFTGEFTRKNGWETIPKEFVKE